MKVISLIFLLIIFSISLCEEYKSGLKKEDFETEIDGKKTDLYVLTNKNGYEISICNYGGHIAAIMAPDKDGNFKNIVQGYNSIDQLVKARNEYLSTLIGRYGNRIRNGTFSLDGKEYTLDRNNGKNHLHGGYKGFHKKVWDAEQKKDQELKLIYISKDGEENYPGTLTVEVTFSLNDDNEFKLAYKAKTLKKTIINLTHHMFINLIGLSNPCPLIVDHILQINANCFLPTDSSQIPTGEIESVKLTPFDFRKPKRVGDALDCTDNPDINLARGIDHTYVLNREREGEMVFAGKVVEPTTKRSMEIYTTEPGMQFYTANFQGGTVGYHGINMPSYSALAFETQHFPDSPNIGYFPSTILKPEDTFVSETIYKFGVEK